MTDEAVDAMDSVVQGYKDGSLTAEPPEEDIPSVMSSTRMMKPCEIFTYVHLGELRISHGDQEQTYFNTLMG